MSTSEAVYKDSQGKIVDPVCGMTVDLDRTEWSSVYKGLRYYFCAKGCLESFETDPEKYLKP